MLFVLSIITLQFLMQLESIALSLSFLVCGCGVKSFYVFADEIKGQFSGGSRNFGCHRPFPPHKSKPRRRSTSMNIIDRSTQPPQHTI